MRLLLVVLLGAFASGALADLYRWIDPETGSVKYSNYPPPWYGDPEQEKRSPRTELIPSRGQAKPAAVAAPAAPAEKKPENVASLEQRFRALLAALMGMPTSQDFTRSGSGFQQRMETYKAVSAELDKLDPKGAERRRAESKPVLDRLVEGLSAQFSAKPPAPPPPPLPATK